MKVNGAGKIVSAMKAKGAFTKINQQGAQKTVLSNKNLDEYAGINLERK